MMVDNRISFRTNHPQSMFQVIEKDQTSERVLTTHKSPPAKAKGINASFFFFPSLELTEFLIVHCIFL